MHFSMTISVPRASLLGFEQSLDLGALSLGVAENREVPIAGAYGCPG